MPEPDILQPQGESAYDRLIPQSVAQRPAAENKDGTIRLMPLVAVLQDGAKHKPAGWHRNEERLARGLPPATVGNHLEAWEKQLVSCVVVFCFRVLSCVICEWRNLYMATRDARLTLSPVRIHNTQALVEVLLLSGGTPSANFCHLAHAWGRERGFHNVLITTVCQRRGDIERKRRSDAGTKAAQKRPRKEEEAPVAPPQPTDQQESQQLEESTLDHSVPGNLFAQMGV